MMKRIIVCLSICMVLLVGSAWIFAETTPEKTAETTPETTPDAETAVQQTDPEQIVAKVNDENILQADVDSIITMFVMPQFHAQNPGQDFPDDQKAQLQKNIVTQLVMEKVLLQKAKEIGVTVDEDQLKQRIEMAAKQRPDVSEEQWRDFLTKNMLIQTLIQQEVVSKIEVSEEEVQKFYEEQKEQLQEPEQVQASHILIKVAQDASEEEKAAAKEKIDEVLALAKEGQDFAALAQEYSEGPSKDNGGDLGFFPRGAMVKPFEDAVFTMNEGDISDVVETQFGYHIIKLTGKKEARDVSFEEVKDRLKEGLVQQKSNTEVMAWVENLKAQATVEIMNP